ncbi:uncharacterized protein EV154DRAFT_570187 [Mucor mucedo]|uniref:uncharacterized protein n=1 Tax=Mucor mucedo TaxID=29922 RepID=UPI0022201B75|nr:uncharacterized protein EV154DRAFT_570187 [Mucor mucedo]KAI7873310.1 hypothetical protein EV154DRAFT_570187 [Mucor mucedo]
MSNQDHVSWSTVAFRGASKKVLRPLPVSPETDSQFKLKGNTLFHHPELDYQIMVRQAASIVKQALTPGSVLFSFPASLFKHRREAYELIEAQCGTVQGFRPISNYGTRSAGEIMVEVKFWQQYTCACQDDSFANSGQGYVSGGSKRSLRYYGEVYQVKQYTCNGYFEGELSVILDISAGYIDVSGDKVKNEPLTNNLYLEEWDCFASASFKDAPTVCHWCRLTRNARSKCPELAKTKCFSCRGSGHTAKFCKKKNLGVTELPVLDKIPTDLPSPTFESFHAQVLSDSDTDISDVSTSPKFEPSGSAASKLATTVASVYMEVDNHMNTTTPASSTAIGGFLSLKEFLQKGICIHTLVSTISR